MKKVALEGPINACTDTECLNWRYEAIKQLGNGFTFHNPMDFDCRGKEAQLEQELIHYDTVGIASSDIILVMADKPGWGTAMAVQIAWEQHKTIITVCPSTKPSPWLKNRSNSIFPDLNSACKYIKEILQ